MRVERHHLIAGGLLLLIVLGLAFGAYQLRERLGLYGSRVTLGDLPLVEVPAEAPEAEGEPVAVFLSADSRWARLDQGVARQLARQGIGVVGWNSLRSYLAPRSPDEAAAGLSRVIDHYTRRWRREDVLLVGFAFGADVLPVLVDRLPSERRERIRGLVLLDFGASADLLSRPGDWLGRAVGGQRRPALAAARQIRDLPVLCIEAEAEASGACRQIGGANVTVAELPAERSPGMESRLVSGMILRWLSTLEVGPP